MDGRDLDLLPRARYIAKLLPEGVRTDPDPTDVVEDGHVPDGENRGE